MVAMLNSGNTIKIIGLTGNSGSGKSYIASKLARDENAFVISADEIAHSVLEPGGAAYDEVISAFGTEILKADKLIDRKLLGDVVFSDASKRELLEAITHKHIIAEMYRLADEAQKSDNNYKYIILDAPLLIEANMQDSVDEVWLVRADVEKRLDRIMARDKISREDALKRFAAQTSFEELARFADRIIDN